MGTKVKDQSIVQKIKSKIKNNKAQKDEDCDKDYWVPIKKEYRYSELDDHYKKDRYSKLDYYSESRFKKVHFGVDVQNLQKQITKQKSNLLKSVSNVGYLKEILLHSSFSDYHAFPLLRKCAKIKNVDKTADILRVYRKFCIDFAHSCFKQEDYLYIIENLNIPDKRKDLFKNPDKFLKEVLSVCYDESSLATAFDYPVWYRIYTDEHYSRGFSADKGDVVGQEIYIRSNGKELAHIAFWDIFLNLFENISLLLLDKEKMSLSSKSKLEVTERIENNLLLLDLKKIKPINGFQDFCDDGGDYEGEDINNMSTFKFNYDIDPYGGSKKKEKAWNRMPDKFKFWYGLLGAIDGNEIFKYVKLAEFEKHCSYCLGKS